jgi:hypothetical protein
MDHTGDSPVPYILHFLPTCRPNNPLPPQFKTPLKSLTEPRRIKWQMKCGNFLNEVVCCKMFLSVDPIYYG